MTSDTYRFEFERSVPIEEAEMSLHLALFAVEGLFGHARVRLEAGYHVDELRSTIILDATTEIGTAIARVFSSLLQHEFGTDSFHIRRVEPAAPAPAVTSKAA